MTDIDIETMKDVIRATIYEAFDKCPVGAEHDKRIRRVEIVGIVIVVALFITHPTEALQAVEWLVGRV